MAAQPSDQPGPPPGRLADNVMHFARVLRAAGMPLATERIQLALTALSVAGLESRADFHATLAACLLDRAEHRALFDQAFALFWRDPDFAGRMMAAMLPRVQAQAGPAPIPENRRLGAALFPHPPRQEQAAPEQTEVEASFTWSDREVLRKADFETMTADEWHAARALLRRLQPLFDPIATRRPERALQPGRPDGRATLRALARTGGDAWQMRWRRPRVRPALLVVLADISGSMSRYSRMLLHFTHALGNAGAPGADARVESFVFGTRLTRTTRALRHRDPDLAVAQVMGDVQDWSGGTRITACLREFNRRWARRVLPGRATVLLVTDGLEHGTPDDPQCAALRFEIERLHKSCRRLVWLNPLLRYAGFEPRAAGIRALLPHVDAFVPAHNLESLESLGRALAGIGSGRGRVTSPR